MKNKIFKFCFLVFTLSLFACNEDKEIELDLPDYTSKIVINGELNNQYAVSVEISKSLPVMKETDSTGYLLTNAVAKLYEDNVFLGNLTYSNLTYSLPVKPVAGRKYKIEVSSSGLSNAYTEIDIPGNISISADFKDTVGYDLEGYPVGQLSVSYQDNGNTRNYYQFIIRTYDDAIMKWFPMKMESNDPVLINNTKLDDGSYVFSDATFNGQYKTMNFSVPFGTVSANPNVQKFEINIKTFSEDYFIYLKQVRDAEPIPDDFETDPIIFKSNVVNGIGMVGGVYNDIVIVK